MFPEEIDRNDSLTDSPFSAMILSGENKLAIKPSPLRRRVRGGGV
jgi:hypothetical protein